jgi:hypothetical protein
LARGPSLVVLGARRHAVQFRLRDLVSGKQAPLAHAEMGAKQLLRPRADEHDLAILIE